MREQQKMIERSRTPSVRALDDVSDHMAQVLRHADELLAEWARFGASVRGQVERETVAIGEAVAGAIDASVRQAYQLSVTTSASLAFAAASPAVSRVAARLP